MSETVTESGGSKTAARARKDAWNWHPPLPLEGIPVFVWPPRPLAALKYVLSLAFLGSVMLPFGVLAVVTWTYLQPPLASAAEIQAGWILQIYLRNLALMVIVAGGLQLYFYTFKRQGSERKYDPRDLTRAHRRFFSGNQVRDNMLWTLASGVTVWTAYEAFFIWAYANDLLPYYLDWSAHPVLFLLTLLAIPFWASFHFYVIHRLLHWPPLYKIAHAVHHRNDNTGPWSGLSMHPIEHVIYLSSVLIHLVIASHPIHILFHNQWNTLGAATTHTGFDSLTIRGVPILNLGSFFHQLHHRYYHCNYGNEFMPWDRWFGSANDGSPEAMARMRASRRAVARPATT